MTLLRSIFSLGTSPNIKESENRLTRICNRVSILAIVGSIYLLMNFFFLNRKDISLYYIPQIILFSLVPYVNHIGYLQAARFLVVMTTLIFVLTLGCLFGGTYNAQFYFIVATSLCLMFFSTKHLALAIFSVGAAIFCNLFYDYLDYKGVIPLIDISDFEPSRLAFMMTDTLLASLAIGLITFYEKKEHMTYEQKLEDLNATLESKVLERTKQLMIEKEKAEKANKLKTEVLRNMSHEFRTPIAAINGHVQIGQKQLTKYQEDHEGDKRLEKNLNSLSKIKISNNRMLELVNRLLSAAKADSAEGLQPRFQKTDLTETIKKTLEYIHGLASTKNMVVDFIFHGDQEFIVEHDSELIGELCSNLLTNAIKYGTEGTDVIISLQDKDEMLQIDFTNQGLGIPLEEADSIFDTFYQSSNTNRETGGTGLGLSICKSIAQAHGGDIFVSNCDPRQTTFTLKLPKERH